MPETLRVVKEIMSRTWTQRTKILVLIVVMTLVVPQPAKGQFIDVAAIVAAIGAINTAITNIIGAGLRASNSELNAVNTVLNAIQSFFQNTIYPPANINRARGVVGAVQAFYNVIRGQVNLNVSSATLANPRQLESVLLSRNAGDISQVNNRFTTVYQAVPPPTDAPPPVRDLIDMTDATAQSAFKKAIAIDAAADQLMDASDQLLAELAVTAAHALTQSATAELFRIRAIDMANTGASLKFNANHASDTRRDVTNMFKK